MREMVETFYIVSITVDNSPRTIIIKIALPTQKIRYETSVPSIEIHQQSEHQKATILLKEDIFIER